MRFVFIFDLLLKAAVFCIFLLADQKLSFADTGKSCAPMIENALFSPKVPNLQMLYNELDAQKSKEQLEVENLDFLKALHGYIPHESNTRAQAPSIDLAYRIMDIVENHPVVGRGARDRYRRENAELGFCFGRAMYIHLLLLKSGVSKDSIKKIWSVGPTKTNMPGIIWGHHVSILLYTKEKGWVAIDTNEVKPQTVQSWVDSQISKSVDGKIKFYLTGAEKFGLETIKYTKVNLGFFLDRENDWYRHYFIDMLNSIKQETLESYNLPKLNPLQNRVVVGQHYKAPRKPVTMLEKLQDTFWIFQ